MANRDFKIELDNVEMINGSDDLLKDTKVTKVTLTGENKLNSLNSTFENCTELTSIEGDINLDGISDMTEMAFNTTLDELKIINPTEENIQADNSLNQVANVKIGGTKYAKGGIQDVVGSLEWTAENFTYEDAILDNVYTNSSSIEESKNITVSDTLEQKATSIEITGQTYENLVNGKATKNLLDEMSMQQTEGKPTQFAPHMEQPICLEYIEGQTYQNLVDGKGEETLIIEYSPVINDFVPNTFKPPQNQPICLESMEGETYQNLIEGKGEYKLTDTFSTTWTESNNSIENAPSMIEIPEIWGNTVQGLANSVSTDQIVTSLVNTINTGATSYNERYMPYNNGGYLTVSDAGMDINDYSLLTDECFIQLKPNTAYSYDVLKVGTTAKPHVDIYCPSKKIGWIAAGGNFTTDNTGKIIIYPTSAQDSKISIKLVEGNYNLVNLGWDYDLNYIQSVGDLYVDESGEPILDEEGNEQYKLEIESANNINLINPNNWTTVGTASDHIQIIKLEPNTKYIYYGNQSNNGLIWHSLIYCDAEGNETTTIFSSHCPTSNVYRFTTGNDNNIYIRAGWSASLDAINKKHLPMLVKGSTVLPYIEGTGNNQSNKTTILMPHQLKKIGSIKHYHQSIGDKWYPACSKLYYDYNAQKFFMKHVPTVEHNILDVLTTMNPFVEITTKSYNSEDYYAIDIHFSINNNKFGILGTGGVDDICFIVKTNYPLPILTGREVSMDWGTSNTTKLEGYSFGYVSSHSHGWSFLLHIKSSNFGDRTLDKDGVIDFFTTYPTSFVALKNQDYTMYLETLDNVYDIVETKILEKPSLDAYSPKTYITTNSEVQPSQMSITNKKVDFIPLGLQPNKDYTLQLDSVGKDDKLITVNLGGATTTIQPTNNTSKHHRVSITTPSELTTDNLDLSGEGVIVNDVMLFEGNTSAIKQDVDYIDGIQSIGELFESRNLFDYTQSEVGLLDHTNGKISKDNSWKYTTDFIPVEPNTTYCISQTSGSVFNYKIVEYNSSKAYLKGTNWTSSKGTDINRAYNTFTTSANTYYLRLGWQSSIFEIQLEEDTFPTEFMAFDTVRYKLEIQTYDSTWDKL